MKFVVTKYFVPSVSIVQYYETYVVSKWLYSTNLTPISISIYNM